MLVELRNNVRGIDRLDQFGTLVMYALQMGFDETDWCTLGDNKKNVCHDLYVGKYLLYLLVHYGVEEALNAGLFEIGFVTGRNKRAINDYFDANYELEKEIAGSGKEELLTEIRDVINRD